MALHTKPKQYVKRVLLSLLIVVISFSVLSMIASAVFYSFFFPRQDTSPAFSMSYEDLDPAAYPRTKRTLLSGENTLTGYCYTCNSPEALVVIAAGFGESCEMHLSETAYFVDSGFDVFCYDCTGVGESEGSGTVGLSQPALDLQNVLDDISGDAELGQLPIVLYGFSAGGYAASAACERDEVRAAVILSGFESPTTLMRETARSYVSVLADIEYPFLSLQNRMVFGDNGGKSASQILNVTDVPVAVYEGADDLTVPRAARLSSYLDAQSNDNLTLVVCDEAPRSGHSGVWLTDEANEYRANLSENATEIDTNAANELDPVFMREITAFYRSALSE